MPQLLDESTQFVDVNGIPVVGGSLYISTKGTDGAPDGGGNPSVNLLVIYSDRELTTPIANPQLTGSTGRVLNKIWIPEEYALLLHDSEGVQKLQDLDAGSVPTYTKTEPPLSAITSPVKPPPLPLVRSFRISTSPAFMFATSVATSVLVS